MKRSYKIIGWMFAVHLIGGMGAYFFEMQGESPLTASTLLGLPMAIFLFMWCKADTSERQVPPPPAATVLVGLAAPLGIPYYFLRALPWRQAAVLIVLAIAAYVCMQLVFLAGWYIGYLF